MSLNTPELARVTRILNRDLAGAIVRKALCPAVEDRIVLELRTPGTNHFLQIVTASGQSRIGRVNSKPEVAPEPHPFVMLLRGNMHGLRIDRIELLGNDRVVAMDLSSSDRSGRLICEMTSRHGNLFWLDSKGIIAGSFYPNRSHKRKLVPCAPYIPPAPHGQTPPPIDRFKASEKDLETEIETHYLNLEKSEGLSTDRARTRRLATRVSKKLSRLAVKLEGDLASALEADQLTHKAYVLQANLSSVKRGQTQLDAVDFEGQPCTVTLDERKGPVENMQRMFDKAKRLRRASDRIFERQSTVETELAWIGGELEHIDTDTPEELQSIRERIFKRFPEYRDRESSGRKQQARRSPFRQIPISHGRIARVGRSATDNDALTLRHARPDDLWLHARGLSGSHVVIPMGRGEDPSPEILVDGALLAAHFSSAQGDQDVEVTYTRRRYVQKPRGAAPGSVRLLKEKTIQLRVDEKRLNRLLHPDID